jgi:hypothetical protein
MPPTVSASAAGLAEIAVPRLGRGDHGAVGETTPATTTIDEPRHLYPRTREYEKSGAKSFRKSYNTVLLWTPSHR